MSNEQPGRSDQWGQSGQSHQANPNGRQGQSGPTGQPGQPGGATAAEGSSGGVSWGSLIGILLIGALVIGGWYFFMRKDPVVVGSCISQKDFDEADGSSGDYPGAVDCDDEVAGYRVLAIAEEPGELECIDVPGATSVLNFMYTDDVSAYCLAGVDEDVERNINDVEVGECVVLEGDDAMRIDCAEPGALEVLAIDPEPEMIELQNWTGKPGTCEKLGAPEATQYYKWGLPTSGFFSDVPDYQKGICMAEVH